MELEYLVYFSFFCSLLVYFILIFFGFLNYKLNILVIVNVFYFIVLFNKFYCVVFLVENLREIY